MLDNPIDAFLRATQAKNQNRQQMNQDIASMGQGLGQGFNTIGQAMQEQKKKALLAQIVQAMQAKGQPIQGPQGYKAPNQGPGSTIVPAGQPSPGNPQLLQSLMMQYDPAMGIKMMQGHQQKQYSPYRIIPGMLSKGGKPVRINEQTGQVEEVGMEVTPTGRGNAAFGTGSIDWNSATDQDKELAKALYEGRIRPGDLGYRDRSIAVKLAEQYSLLNKLPPYKAYAGNVAGKTAEGFATGKLGMNTLALNTALGHVDSAYRAYQDVANTNSAWLNIPLNKLRKSTNDPKVVRLGLTLNALRGELATVFKGSSGTDQDAKQWMDYLNENLTPDQINGAIPQVDELLRSRLSALDYQRSSGMSGRGERPLLSPHGATISNRLGSTKKSAKNIQKIGRFEVEVQP